jgi:hypothetical protein
MAERTQGNIEICRDHPNPETAESLIHLRPVDRAWPCDEIASVYCARVGTEQEANAEFIVRAWNSHDSLVNALTLLAEKVEASGGSLAFRDELTHARAALAAGGEA